MTGESRTSGKPLADGGTAESGKPSPLTFLHSPRHTSTRPDSPFVQATGRDRQNQPPTASPQRDLAVAGRSLSTRECESTTRSMTFNLGRVVLNGYRIMICVDCTRKIQIRGPVGICEPSRNLRAHAQRPCGTQIHSFAVRSRVDSGVIDRRACARSIASVRRGEDSIAITACQNIGYIE